MADNQSISLRRETYARLTKLLATGQSYDGLMQDIVTREEKRVLKIARIIADASVD